MGAADGNGSLIILHKLTQQLCPGKTGEMHFPGGGIFGIVLMDGAGENNAVDVSGNIIGSLSIKYSDASCLQHIGQRASGPVRTGHLKACVSQDFRQAAHADAADTHKVDMGGGVKIDFEHRVHFLIV